MNRSTNSRLWVQADCHYGRRRNGFPRHLEEALRGQIVVLLRQDGPDQAGDATSSGGIPTKSHQRLISPAIRSSGLVARPGVAAVTVDGRLPVDFSHALQSADKEGVDGHESDFVRYLDVPLAELRAEPLQQADLLVGEGEPALGGGLLQTQQPFVLGQQPVTLPNPADTA